MNKNEYREPKALKISWFYFFVTLVFHIVLYSTFWSMDPIWRNDADAGTVFMRVGALASVFILAVDFLVIKYLSSKAKTLAITPSEKDRNYMWYQNLQNAITWQGALFVLVNTLVWGFGDWIYVHLV